MAQMYVAYGSWRVRHNEPLGPGEQEITLFRVRRRLPLERVSFMVDAGADIDFERGIVLGPDGDRVALEGRPSDAWFEGSLPLAVVTSELLITHGSLRAEPGLLQFMRIPADWQPSGAPLRDELWRFFQLYHLYFANHECYFIKMNVNTELEQKFHLAAPISYWSGTQQLYAAFAEGGFPGYEIKVTDEYQSWSFDNYLYHIQPDPSGDKGYVSAIRYCKKKNQWDDPMWMFKKKVYKEDSLERWERNYENQWVEGDLQDALQNYFEYPTAALPPWRRTRCDVGVESVNGNVFMVNIDDCRVHGTSLPEGRLQQCEIEYMCTRGVPDEARVYEDFNRLVTLVHAFFAANGLGPEQTYYSKLTFLKDYMARAQEDG